MNHEQEANQHVDSMRIYLPYQFDISTMYGFINDVIDNKFLPRNNNIILDFTKLKFIRPSGVTILSNIVQWLIIRGVRVTFTYPGDFEHQNNPVKFLDDSDFFSIFSKKKLSQSSRPRTTTIPLKLVKYDESYGWIENNLIFWLMQRLSLSKGALSNIKVCFAEIFNNIKDHSQNNIGCVFGQHFPGEHVVQIAISDFGVGIPHNVKKILPNLDDSNALLKATEEGFSTKSNIRNAGAGLDILIHNVALQNRGILSIYSNCGAIQCNYDNGNIAKTMLQVQGYYPGTLIYVELRTDTIIQDDDDSEEFEW
jgi:anti-sigma regulatory factor (Ser/Thr protein kinase)